MWATQSHEKAGKNRLGHPGGGTDLVASISLSATPTASGVAPPPYLDTTSSAGTGVSVSLDLPVVGSTPVLSFGSGEVSVEAGSDVDGLPGFRTAYAVSTVNDVSIDVAELLGGVLGSFFQLNASQIEGYAEVSGDVGAITPTGATLITGAAGQASLSILGVDFLLDISPAANTSFTIDSTSDPGLAALTGSIDVFLNEQFVAGNGSTFSSIAVNALRLQFNGVGIVGLGPDISATLDGEVTIGHAEAALQAVKSATPRPRCHRHDRLQPVKKAEGGVGEVSVAANDET